MASIMKYFRFILIGFYILSLISCKNPQMNEGYINVEGGQIWYKIIGSADGIPVLFIHGGPGSRSCQMMHGYSELGENRPLIFYDQLESGNSDRTNDTTLWKIERFVNEIDSIRKYLSLNELHILGHSWGSAVLIEYLITKNPEGIKSAIFSSPYISTEAWLNDAGFLLKTLPQYLQDTIRKYEQLQEYQSDAYLAATDSFYYRFLSRNDWPTQPPPECNGVTEFNETVYYYMWGPSEFTISGTLKDYDRVPDLEKIEISTLFIAGEYDEVRAETLKNFHSRVTNSEMAIIKGASHYTMINNPDETNKKINDFLKVVENND
jgi:proline iminopeptidase